MDVGDLSTLTSPRMDMIRLRSIIHDIEEKLPPLLELGSVPKELISEDFDFPYHRPSIISVATAESTMMPESLGFVLLQVRYSLYSIVF